MVNVSLMEAEKIANQIFESSRPNGFLSFFFPQLLQQTDVYFSKSVGRSISFPFLVLQEYIRRFRSIGYCDIQFVRKPAKKDMSEQNIQEFYVCFLCFKISPVFDGGWIFFK